MSPSATTTTKPQVTVTGGSGYIASVLIDELLKRGYRVNATVRSIAKATVFQERFPTVKLFEADLSTPGAFDASFAGSEVIFHTASPAVLQSNDPENEIIKPAVQGTESVMRAALATPTVRRIVVTSSNAAAMTTGSTSALTEESWNQDAPGVGLPYFHSKTLAERKAWSMIKEYEASEAFKARPVSLVTVLPVMTVGPPIFSDSIRSSLAFLLGIVDGSAKAQGGLLHITATLVDVRDIAKAHIDAAENPKITGRLLASHPKALSFKEIADKLIKRFPQLARNIPTEYASPEPLFPAFSVENSRTEKQLGWNFAEPEQAIFAFVESMIAAGHVKINA